MSKQDGLRWFASLLLVAGVGCENGGDVTDKSKQGAERVKQGAQQIAGEANKELDEFGKRIEPALKEAKKDTVTIGKGLGNGVKKGAEEVGKAVKEAVED